MEDNENGYSLKEILNETRVNVENHRSEFLSLRDKYEKQSTTTKEKAETDIDRLGRGHRDLEKRVYIIELRVYAAIVVISAIGWAVQNYLGK